MKYAIPSYKRAGILKTHTLAFLQKNNIAIDNIYIFVVPEEVSVYKEALPDYQIITGRVGLKEQRNFISEYFSEGEYICSMDDDIKDIIIKRSETDFISVDNFEEVVVKGFEDCKKYKANLFGFYPVYNKLWMKDNCSTDFKFIIGSCFGYINRKIKITLPQKQDYQISILHYLRDKVVLRYNYISIKTNYYKTKGGLQSFDNRLEQQQEAVKYLTEQYPDYFAIKKSFKSGYPELRIKRV